MNLNNKDFNLLRFILAGMIIAGIALPLSGQNIVRGVEKNIPHNANRILLKQTEVPPADVYVDALNHLKRKDFEITASEETFDDNLLEEITESRPLVFSAKKQINDTLAIRIQANVDKCSGPLGGLLIASVDYAKDVAAPIPEWKHASWNKPEEQDAFFKVLEILRGTSYDFMNFEVGVAVTTDKKSK